MRLLRFDEKALEDAINCCGPWPGDSWERLQFYAARYQRDGFSLGADQAAAQAPADQEIEAQEVEAREVEAREAEAQAAAAQAAAPAAAAPAAAAQAAAAEHERKRVQFWQAWELTLLTCLRDDASANNQTAALAVLLLLELELITTFEDTLPSPGLNWDKEVRRDHIENLRRRLLTLRRKQPNQRKVQTLYQKVIREAQNTVYSDKDFINTLLDNPGRRQAWLHLKNL